jgi:hypothetical protein
LFCQHGPPVVPKGGAVPDIVKLTRLSNPLSVGDTKGNSHIPVSPSAIAAIHFTGLTVSIRSRTARLAGRRIKRPATVSRSLFRGRFIRH